MASLWVCSEDRLRPVVAEASRIKCNQTTASTTSTLHTSAGTGSAAPFDQDRRKVVRSTLQLAFLDKDKEQQRADRSSIGFHVGQMVVNKADGTKAVVIGWDRVRRAFVGEESQVLASSNRKPQNAAKQHDLAARPHVFIMAGRGQVPTNGVLKTGAFGLPGRVAYVSQELLAPLPLPRQSPAVDLPLAALTGESKLFSGFDAYQGRFLPVPALEFLYPHDAEAAEGVRAITRRGVFTDATAGNSDAVSGQEGAAARKSEHSSGTDEARVMKLIDRIQAARPSAVARYADAHSRLMSAKQEQLKARLQDVEKLQARLSHLTSMVKNVVFDSAESRESSTEDAEDVGEEEEEEEEDETEGDAGAEAVLQAMSSTPDHDEL